MGGMVGNEIVVHESGCPWCVIDERHGHLVRDDGSVGFIVLRGAELDAYLASYA